MVATALQDIAASLKGARKAKALTQEQLGERVGLPQSHVSKIEKGRVDLQLSSLTELARALDLEVKLVPRKALPSVEGAIRAQDTSDATSRALAALNQQAEFADWLQSIAPKAPEIQAFQDSIRNLPRVSFNAAQLKALEDALKPTKELQALDRLHIDQEQLRKSLEQVTASLGHFRNARAHLSPPPFQQPAYSLDEDEE